MADSQQLVFATSNREHIESQRLAAKVEKVSVSQAEGTPRAVLLFTLTGGQDGERAKAGVDAKHFQEALKAKS